MPSLDPDVVLRGEGMAIRRPRVSDAEAILAACRDPDIARFTRVPASMALDDVHSFRESGRRDAEEGTALHLIAVHETDDRLLGACGMVAIDWADRWAEVGYWTVAAERGAGVATRATRAVCRYAFDVLELERIELSASVVNPASNAVARRLGFTLEGTRRQAFVPTHDGRAGTDREDGNLWGLLAGELT